MLKLIVCLISAMAVAVVVLQMRQQRLELNYQANQLHNQIESQQAQLWNQQLQIAVYTAPNAIAHTVGAAEDMVSVGPPEVQDVQWLGAADNPDAE
jgi:cell division protein FtsL